VIEPQRTIVFAAHERPLVEVLIEGRWLSGELRMWVQDQNGDWTANVRYTDEAHFNFVTTVVAEQVRKVDET